MGGLRETVVDVSRNGVWGNGFLFYDYSVEALRETLVKVGVNRLFGFLRKSPRITRE